MVPPTGVLVAAVCFMKENEDLDRDAIIAHTSRLAKSGVSAILVQGDNGEAGLLSDEERIEVIRLTRQTLDEQGFPNIPVIAGASAPSVRGTIKLCTDASEAGAAFVLVLAPVAWPRKPTTEDAIESYSQVADASPAPLIIYNFPSVVGGLNLDSDDITRLAQHPNIVGVKLADGEMGKLHRLTSIFTPSHFGIYTSTVDCLTHGLLSGCSGAMAAFPNVTPKLVVRLYELFKAGQVKEAMELQTKLAWAEWNAVKIGKLSVLKAVLSYGGTTVRRPLKSIDRNDLAKSEYIKAIAEVIALELELA